MIRFKTHPIRFLATVFLALHLCAGTVLLSACGEQERIAALRAALKSSPALVQPLVASGVISQALADTYVKDFTDGGEIALTLKVDLDAIPKGATDEKQRQYPAVHKAYDGWKEIVARGHFTKAVPQVQTAFNMADGIWVFVDAYYGDQAGLATHADVGADGLSPDEFKDVLDQKINELKAAMKQAR